MTQTQIYAAKVNAGESWRIVSALAMKDIADALRNKNILSLFVTVAFMVVFYRVMPTFGNAGRSPRLFVYNAGQSSLVTALEDSSAFSLHAYDSTDEMKRALTSSDVPQLGLVIPANFDQIVASNEPIELEGYTLHWVSDDDAYEVKRYAEQQIIEQLDRPVTIHITGNTVYTNKESTGYSFLATMSLLFAIIMLGLLLIPHLMLEEKQTKTMDALLVSPATPRQIVMGKAMVGLFYGLIISTAVLLVNQSLITHWELAIVGMISGVLLNVAFGLLLGSLVNTKQQLQLMAWFFVLPLLVPVFLSIMTDLIPEKAIAVMHWIPTVALSRLFRVSFAQEAPLADYGPELALIIGSTLLILTAVVWQVRRLDR